MSKRTKCRFSPLWTAVVDYRIFLGLIVMAGVFVPSLYIPQLITDPTWRGYFDRTASRYADYRQFVQEFGNDEFVLIAIHNSSGVLAPSFLRSIEAAAQDLRQVERIADVVTICNVKIFEDRNGIFGSYLLLPRDASGFQPVDRKRIEMGRTCVPVMDLLLSKDLKSTSIIVRLEDECRYDPNMGKLLSIIRSTVIGRLSPDSELRMVGAPVIRNTVSRLSQVSGVRFVLLAAAVSLVILFLLFRNGSLTAICGLISTLAIVWILGLMASAGISLNIANAMSFGLVLIVTIATLVHIVTHYREQYMKVANPIGAMKRALSIVGGPAFMCSLTTAVGFGTIMIADVPAMKQLGLIMSVGVILSYVLSIALAPALLIAIGPRCLKGIKIVADGPITSVSNWLRRAVLEYGGLCLLLGLVLMAVMFVGIVRIRINTEILSFFRESSVVVQDLRFVEGNLGPTQAIELVLRGSDRTFKTSEAWEQVSQLVGSLRELPEVKEVDSLLPLVMYSARVLSGENAYNDGLFANSKLIADALVLVGMSESGKALVGRYLNESFSSMRISVRIGIPEKASYLKTIQDVRVIATAKMKSLARVLVTGEATVYAEQSMSLIACQTHTLCLALSLITLLMIIQLRSITLGLVSLVPNILPLVVVFGIMGWFQIRLDWGTIFVASVSIGLSVDGTIHYLTHLKRDLAAAGPTKDTRRSIMQAHRKTAIAITTTSIVLLAGVLVLLTSPFRLNAQFGGLAACAIGTAFFGDLMFMPALLIALPGVARLFSSTMRDSSH